MAGAYCIPMLVLNLPLLSFLLSLKTLGISFSFLKGISLVKILVQTQPSPTGWCNTWIVMNYCMFEQHFVHKKWQLIIISKKIFFYYNRMWGLSLGLDNDLTLLDPGYFFLSDPGGGRFRPPWISAVEQLLRSGWTTILERYKRGPRIQKMRCLSSKLSEWRPFENLDLKCNLLENCHRRSHLLSKIWEGRF